LREIFTMKTPDPQYPPVRRQIAGNLAAALTGLLLCQASAFGADVTWSSSTAGGLWSAPGNWSGGAPAGNNVLFGSTGRTLDASTIGNVADASLTVSSLSYQSIGS